MGHKSGCFSPCLSTCYYSTCLALDTPKLGARGGVRPTGPRLASFIVHWAASDREKLMSSLAIDFSKVPGQAFSLPVLSCNLIRQVIFGSRP